MNALKLLILIFALNLGVSANGAPKKGKIIDLGDMEVQGELRRPNLFMVESRKRLAATIEKAAERKWGMLESTLLTLPPQEELKRLLGGNP